MVAKRLMGWKEWTVVLAAVGISLIVAAILSESVRGFFCSEIPAAWVQAVGAILAIWYAGKFARDDRRNARQDAAQEKIAKLRATCDLLEKLFAAFETTGKHLKGKVFPWDPVTYARQRIAPLELAIETMERLPITETPLLYVAPSILDLRNMMEHALDHLRTIRDSGFEDPNNWKPAEKHIEFVIKHIDRAERYLDSIRHAAEKYDGIKDPVPRLRDLL